MIKKSPEEFPQWEARFSVGNDLLDTQHQQLLALCKAAADCLGADGAPGDPELESVLTELARYARTHFETEEGILREAGYPKLDEQLKDHQDYDESITGFLVSATFHKIRKPKLAETLNKYLANWWIRHILVSDMKYKKYL